MASSSHRQKQLSLAPRDNHSHGCITHKMKTSTCIEDSMKKLAIETEITHQYRHVSKGNHIALEKEVVNKKSLITMDKQRVLVKEEKHVVREKQIVNNINVEKEKKRIPHKHKSAADGEKKIVNNINVEKEKNRIPHKHKSDGEKKIVNNINVEKEKNRIPHKHKSAADGTLAISFKIKF